MPLPDDLKHAQDEALRSAETFSFDVERLKFQIQSGDALTKILKAHLYLEHVLIYFLRDCMPQPDEVDLKRLSFPTKVDLCIALGLIDRELRASLNKVNTMRNRVAHNLDVEISNDEQREFWLSLPAHLRRARAEDDPVGGDFSKHPFPDVMDVLILWLDICRQRYVQERIRSEYAQRYLRRTLDSVSIKTIRQDDA